MKTKNLFDFALNDFSTMKLKVKLEEIGLYRNEVHIYWLIINVLKYNQDIKDEVTWISMTM